MRKRALALVGAVVALGGCGTFGEDEASITKTSVLPPVSATEPPAVPAPDPSAGGASGLPGEDTSSAGEEGPMPPGEATFVQCQLADGTALLSDGSLVYLPDCDLTAEAPYGIVNGGLSAPATDAGENAAGPAAQ